MTCRVTLRGSQIRDEQVSVTVALYSELCLKAYVADVSFLEKGSGHPLAQKQKDVFFARKHTNQFQLPSASAASTLETACFSATSRHQGRGHLFILVTMFVYFATQEHVKRMERRHKMWKERADLERGDHVVACEWAVSHVTP